MPTERDLSLEDRFGLIARLIRQGEWASYGDISIAVVGSIRAARAVARAAARDEDFPNAHRVLRTDGSVARASGPRSDERVERARRALANEGVAFDSSGRADPRARIRGEELALRAARKERHG